jgi:hypothetical protein
MERFCNQVFKEVGEIAARQGEDVYDQFMELHKYLSQSKSEMKRLFENYTRSTAVTRIFALYSENLFEQDEFTKFSPELQELVVSWGRVFHQSDLD